MDWQTPPACPTGMIQTADDLRQDITAVRAELDTITARLDAATDVTDRAVCRLTLRIGEKWLASLEAQLAQVADDR